MAGEGGISMSEPGHLVFGDGVSQDLTPCLGEEQVRTEQVPRVGLSTNHDLASAHGLFLLPDTLFPTSHSSTQISRRGAEVPSSENASLKVPVGVGGSSGVSGSLSGPVYPLL